MSADAEAREAAIVEALTRLGDDLALVVRCPRRPPGFPLPPPEEPT